MFGPRITTVFRSRRNALVWVAGVLATAYCTVPDDAETLPAPVAAAVTAKAPTTQHNSPWAKD